MPWCDVRSASQCGAGTLFVVDRGNNRVRKIRSDGVITTFAGTGAVGVDAGGYAGDGGPATAARLQEPVVGLGAGERA